MPKRSSPLVKAPAGPPGIIVLVHPLAKQVGLLAPRRTPGGVAQHNSKTLPLDHRTRPDRCDPDRLTHLVLDERRGFHRRPRTQLPPTPLTPALFLVHQPRTFYLEIIFCFFAQPETDLKITSKSIKHQLKIC